VEIDAAERELLQLAERLDQPFTSRGDPDDVAMAMGHRARALYRGYLLCAGNDMHNAGRALLRPMVEMNILLRFIREDPEWRAQLWQAETRRVYLGIAEEIHHRPLPAEQKLENLPTLEEIAEFRRGIEELRAEAIAAEVAGVRSTGRLFPSVREQVESLNTTEAWQGYLTAYTTLGFDQHVGHGSFRDAVRYTMEDGSFVMRDDETPRPVERVLASTVFSSTLVIVSTWLHLGIDEAAKQLQEHLVAWSPKT
jgi:hypothetical protein